MNIRDKITPTLLGVASVVAAFGIAGAAVFVLGRAGNSLKKMDLGLDEGKWFFRK